jgi:hypothetical protein
MLMASCWNADPDTRPAFDTIRDDLMKDIENERYSTILPLNQETTPTRFS